jgi:hypothetical protein
MSFEQNLKFGQAGETSIAKWLRARGNTVLPVYEKIIDTGKGPQIFTPDGSLVAPDFMVWKGASVQWIEAKHKEAFTWHRLTSRWVTGIDLRHYHDYCQLGDSSPWPVWVLFLHRGGHAKDSPNISPLGLFGNSLSYLRTHENHRSDKHGRSGMVYWSIDHLMKIGDEIYL